MLYKECLLSKISFAVILFVLGFSLIGCRASIETHLSNGENSLQKRKFGQAVMEFRAAADIDKNSVEAHYGLARAFENLGQVYDSIGELQAVVQLVPKHLEARTKLGNLFLLMNPPQTNEAQKQIEQILAYDPNYAEGHVLQASLLSAQNRPEAEVVAVLNRAISVNPDRPETYISAARFFMKQNNGARAEEMIRKAISVSSEKPLGYLEYGRFYDYSSRPADAEAQFRNAVERAPADYEVREAVAHFYLNNGQFDKAEQAFKDVAAVLENSPEGLMETAEFYDVVGRDDDAVRTLQAILETSPQFAPARYRLGEVWLEKKQFEKVAEQTEILLSVDDTDAEALMLRARMLLQKHETEAAIADLEEILKRQPSSRPALFYTAQSYLALGQADRARAFIGDLKRYHPMYLSARLPEIQMSFAAGEPENALRQTNELLAELKTTYPSYETSAQDLEELRVRALGARGLAYLELDKFGEARADLEEVLKLSPNSSSSAINLAKVFVAQKNFDEADALYRRVLNADRKNFDALEGAVAVRRQRADYDSALQILDKALNESAADAKTVAALHYLKADVYKAQKDFARAESELQKSVETDADFLPAYSSFAALLVSRGEIDRAVAEYDKVVARKPSAAAYTLIGMLEDARGKVGEAEKNYRKALEIEPETPIAANNLAWLIIENGRGSTDEALRLSQTVVDRNAPNSNYYDTLGWIYYKKGLLLPAVEKLKKAVALEESDARKSGRTANSAYRLHLGRALAETGDKFSAKREVETALQKAETLTQRDLDDARNLLAAL